MTMRLAASLLRLVLAIVVGVSTARCGRNAESFTCATRFSIPPPSNTQLAPQQIPAVSPDGSRVAFIAVGPDRIARVWLHAVTGADVRDVPGTDGAAFPFWSPDGERLGFFADGRLKLVDLRSEAVQTLTDAPDGLGGSWNAQGIIIFSAGAGRGIFSIPAAGGSVRRLVSADDEYGGVCAWPRFVSDGEHFMYSSDKNDSRELVLASLRSTEQNRLQEGTASPMSIIPGSLLFAAGHALLGVRFNSKILEIEPPMGLVAQGVANGPHGTAAFSASADGSVVVYGRSGTRIVWVNAAGRVQSAIPDPGAYAFPTLSPSRDEILVTIGVYWLGGGAGAYYVYDMKSNRLRHVADGAGRFHRPLWSADGTEIVFTASDADDENTEIRAVQADGSGVTRKIFDETAGAYVAAISPQRGLMAVVEHPDGGPTRGNLRVVSLAGRGGLEASTVWQRKTPWNEYGPAFSPDGLRLAYISTQSGKPELYVTDLVGNASPSQVSVHGAAAPVWSPDGKQLFYGDDSGLVAVSTEGPPSTWRSHLFLRDADAHTRMLDAEVFDVAADGTRLLMLQDPDPQQPPELVGMTACGSGRMPAP